jgi:hypothetical protein
VGTTSELSDELDSAFASNAKAVKPLLAGIGKSGKELRRLTSQAAGMAFSMNVSAESVGKVMVEMESAGGPAKAALDALGMSTKDWVKFTEVSGIEMQKMTSVMSDMQTSWNMTAKQAASTAEAVLSYGQAAGVGTKALETLDPLLEKMNGLLADAPPGMQLTADQMQGLVIGATKLAGAYREMGATQEQAMEYSSQTAELFVKESMAFQKALEGRGEYGEFAKGLMPLLETWQVNWQDFGEVLKVGAKDSTKGMIQLNQIVQQASAKGFGPTDVLMRQLLGTIQETSPAMAWLAQNTTQGADALRKFDAIAVQSDGSIKKLGQDGFSSGRTLQESFDLARKSMWHTIRSIAGPEVSGMVKTQMGAYRDMGKEIVGLGKDKTWGPLIKKAVILKRMGLRGLLMSGADTKESQRTMAKTFAGMEIAAEGIEAVVGAANPLMTTLGKLGPLGTLAGGIATWFSMDQKQRDDIWNSVAPVFDIIKQKASDVWFGADGKEGLKDNLADAWDSFVAWLKATGVPMLKEGLAGIGSLMMDLIGAAMSDPKIGISAAVGAGLLVGGQFGPFGAIVGMASGAIIAAYMQADAEVKRLLSEEEKRKKNLEKMATAGARIAMGTSDLPVSQEGWEYDVGMGADESAWYKQVAESGEQNVDYAAQWAKDTEAQLAMVDRVVATSKGKASALQNLMGIPEMVGWGMAARVKRDTGKRDEVSWLEDMASTITDATGLGNKTTDTMRGYGNAIGAVQTSPGQQGLLGAAAGQGPGAMAAMVAVLPMQLQKMAQAQQQVFGAVEKTVADTDLYLQGATATMTTTSAGLGTTTMTALAQSITDNEGFVQASLAGALQIGMVDQVKSNSPPVSGPLSEAAGNPLYNGGYGMMSLIADGIDAGLIEVQTAMSSALVQSIQFAMGEYEAEAAKLLSTSDVMAKVTDKVVRNLTGIGTITLSTEEKRVLKASLDVPGMAGVTGAILADGNLTRKVLERIATATEGIYDNLGGQAGKGGHARVTLASA